MKEKPFFNKVMDRYRTPRAVEPDELEKKLLEFMKLDDGEMEGYTSEEIEQQRALSVKFQFGHNHDFGTFVIDGIMGNRHIEIMSMFCGRLGLPTDLSSKKVLDIGIWCGGTTLLLAGMGAEVFAIEEIKKYCWCADYLFYAFQNQMDHRPAVLNMSLYDIDYNDVFDYVIFPGVLYHLTDPVLALRILFNALKDGGQIFIETAFEDAPGDVLLYRGPMIAGNNWFFPSPSALDAMLRDVGFEVDIKMLSVTPGRYIVRATRHEWRPMMKAGLSRRIR